MLGQSKRKMTFPKRSIKRSRLELIMHEVTKNNMDELWRFISRSININE
jgi:hypothetical protein